MHGRHLTIADREVIFKMAGGMAPKSPQMGAMPLAAVCQRPRRVFASLRHAARRRTAKKQRRNGEGWVGN
jgi:hypothetical protein